MTNATDNTSKDRRNGQDSKPVRLNPTEQEVLDDLNELGFDRPVDFIRKYGGRRIQRALALLRAKPAGSVKNPSGFIRYLVMSGHGLPPVKEQPAKPDPFLASTKFITQKYGDVVQR